MPHSQLKDNSKVILFHPSEVCAFVLFDACIDDRSYSPLDI